MKEYNLKEKKKRYKDDGVFFSKFTTVFPL